MTQPPRPFADPFQALTVRINGVSDRVMTEIHVTQGFDPAGPPDPLPPSRAAHALWDTGATRSSISPGLVSALGLTPVGAALVNHGGGTETKPTHLVNFRLPNSVNIAGLLVTELPLQGFDVLIGMDVICLGDLSLTHAGGKTCMSFRTPTIGGVDYVAQHRDYMKSVIPRNAACPCGKKKPDGTPVKFKACCGQ